MYKMLDYPATQSRSARRVLASALAVGGMLAVLGCGSDPDQPGNGAGATGGGGSGGVGGGGGTAGAGGEGGAVPQPIVADEDTWTWVPIDGAVCGTGSPTGLGINPTSKSGKLLIYLQGGGVCYNADNCLGSDPSADNFDGFGPTEFAEFTGGDGTEGLFDRADSDNPFRDFSFVFVPYCTGDIHAGNKVTNGLSFVGQANLVADLARLVPTFPSPDLLVLTGTSAGGFGSMYNFQLVEAAFAPAPAILIDDSGPFFPISATPALSVLVNIFGLKDTVAPACEKCLDMVDPDGGLHQLIPHYAKTLPGRRGSLISSMQDETIASNFTLTGEAFEAALTDLADDVVPTNPDFHVYFLTGSHHVWLFGGETGTKLGDVTSQGVKLSDFLRQQLDDDSGWADVRP